MNEKLSVDDKTIYSKRKNHCPFSVPPLEDYAAIVGEKRISDLQALAKPLEGVNLLSINASAQGGGVAELLYSATPFMAALGMESEWKVLPVDPEFFEVTKSLHNILQGKKVPFTPEMEQCYSDYIEKCAGDGIVDDDVELVLVQDPQPLGLAEYYQRPGRKWLWRCHIDIEDLPQDRAPGLWDFLNRRIAYYDAAIFSAMHYIVSLWQLPSFIIPPFIDPLSEKNRELTQEEIDTVLAKYKIDPDIPIILQIGRFDPWKGIDRSIAIYHEVKKKVDCQLVLAGGLAIDDPEGTRVLEDIRRKTEHDETVRLLHLSLEPRLENWHEVNALQRAASIIMQPSLREGFGLTVTEALWKGKPVVAARAGAIPLQIRDGSNGYFYQTVEETASVVLDLLNKPEMAAEVGNAAVEYVKEHFLMPDRVYDWLRVMNMIYHNKVNKEDFGQSIISFHPWFKLAKRK